MPQLTARGELERPPSPVLGRLAKTSNWAAVKMSSPWPRAVQAVGNCGAVPGHWLWNVTGCR